MSVLADPAAPLLRLEDALARMLAGVVPLPAEEIDLEAAVGRVLADPLAARVTMPPFANSAMDGFAVRSADVADASPQRPVQLAVIGEVAAGLPAPREVGPGTAIRIFTGAMLPAGADTIVPVESTDAPWGVADLPSRVGVHRAPATGEHVRAPGSDITAGQRLVTAGQVVRPATLALLASGGYGRVPVHRRPRVTIVSTGDELVAPGAPLAPGRIHDSNGPMLAALAAEVGADATRRSSVADDLPTVTATLTEAVAESDVVLTSGGVSMGARDVVRLALESVGRLELWRVAVQPGKPLAFARASRGPDEVLLFGLPGNPVSSFVTFELFVRPVLRRLAGHASPESHATVRARLAEPVVKHDERRAFLRVRLAPDPGREGGWLATLAGGQGSHVLSALAAADGLAVVPEEVRALPAGAEVEVWMLHREGD
ncbi:MAG TPA: gephyrin-like molybdotransferase Glp [Candidatus Sulfotelmatobacter sp.]|nr:gephyrin-like molybdotransferase Glp [Candidatus Sulfotelmatobacter sp.]